MPITVGSHVKIGAKRGVVQFIGETSFATGEWYGIELDCPKGKNDGTVNGDVYFSCPPNHGLFCKKAQVRVDRSYKAPPAPAPAPAAPTPTPTPTPTPAPAVVTSLPAAPPAPTIYIPKVGDLASFKEETGTIMFVGETEFSEGIWCGLMLPTPTGKNDGSVKGTSYFVCEQKHGLFVKPDNLIFVGKQASPVATASTGEAKTAPAVSRRSTRSSRSATLKKATSTDPTTPTTPTIPTTTTTTTTTTTVVVLLSKSGGGFEVVGEFFIKQIEINSNG